MGSQIPQEAIILADRAASLVFWHHFCYTFRWSVMSSVNLLIHRLSQHLIALPVKTWPRREGTSLSQTGSLVSG